MCVINKMRREVARGDKSANGSSITVKLCRKVLKKIYCMPVKVF